MRRDAPRGKIGLRIVGRAPGQGVLQFEVAALLAIQKGLLLLAHDLHLHADLFQVRLHVLPDAALLRVLRIVVQAHTGPLPVLVAPAVGRHEPSGPVQQAGRLFRVMAASFQRQVAIRHRGGQQAGSHGLGTVEDGGGDAFLVHRVLQGQAHVPLPGEGLMSVEQYGPRGDGLADGRRIAPLTADGIEIVQIEHVAIGPEHQIHVPLVQGQQDGLMVGHHLPAHGLQAGLLPPVGGIGREQGVLVLLVFLQDPRPRAHKAARR